MNLAEKVIVRAGVGSDGRRSENHLRRTEYGSLITDHFFRSQ